MPKIHIPAQNRILEAPTGVTLLEALRRGGLYPDAPCGGQGSCGKCKALVNGQKMLACRTVVDRDLTVEMPQATLPALTQGVAAAGALDPLQEGYLVAFDIGTTSVVCALLEGKTGRELACLSMRNPQCAFGADVVSRMQAALRGELESMSTLIRDTMTGMVQKVCRESGISPRTISMVSVVGNPAMQQLFLGIEPRNLMEIPFAPVLTQIKALSCGTYLPICANAQLLVVPDISGYVGADTIGCLLATELYKQEKRTLLVDIGTNGEMVLGNKHRMIACATAAGPALEGANIQFGMRASEGAIDHVWLEKGNIAYSVIGGGEATGICGSGLVDAVAVGLKLGLLNMRGKILTADGILPLTNAVYLTQEDIRQVQLAKGAIHAGITLMAAQLGIRVEEIEAVRLAGAFGCFLDASNACRIGLLPEALEDKIDTVGNAALAGAVLLACDQSLCSVAQRLTETVECLELANLPAFPRTFAKAMLFREEEPASVWLEKAKAAGFDVAVPLNPGTLVAREDVRDMCAQDKCGAYGKNWTCPPAVGTLEDCQRKMKQYRQGILLQTVGHMTKTIDSKCYRETERRHNQQLSVFAEEIRKAWPEALCLGAGGCRVCKKCAYPEACWFPEKAVSGVEAYGLFVTQLCRDAGVPYHYGEKTIAYTALVLF